MTQELQRGDAIQVHPLSALWATGARFGEVVQVAARKGMVLVRLDTGRRDWLSLSSVLEA